GTQFSRNLHARHGTPDTAGRAGVVCRAPARAPGRTMAAYRALERFRRCRLSRLLELRPTRSGVESHPIWLRLAMGPHNLEGRAKASRWTARRRVCPYRASSPAITIEPADETLPEDHGRPGAGIPGTTARGAGAGHALGTGEPGEPPAGHYRRGIPRFPGRAGPGRAPVRADPGSRRPGSDSRC